jgi:hypothetical protein
VHYSAPYVLKGKDYNHKEQILPEESPQQIQHKRIDRLQNHFDTTRF